MSNFYGIGNDYSSLFNSMLGGSSSYGSSGMSFMSSLGDLQMIQSGVYKKALTAYYKRAKAAEADSDSESISGSGKADSNVKLSSLKSAANKLSDATAKLRKQDYSKVTGEDILDDAKNFVDSYNTALNSTKNMNSYSILQTAVWMTEQMNTGEGLLNKVGISINADNTLSLDEDKFKEAASSDLKALFEGSGSFASRIASKASSLANQSANQLSMNNGYGMYNVLGKLIG